ncbi:MAG: prolipoprotein diacylglyceryl transferase [Clostridia bacterium]|nr:prolipoprotein diacylglyceryl transferase [Clostridia bacterium]
MKPEIIIAISIGTVAMFGVMAFCRRWYKSISLIKLLIAAPLLTASGTVGAYLLFFVENGEFGGISFYGSLFLIPVLFIPVSLLLRTKFGELTDLCAPSVALMLAINKINCIRTNCCKGMVIGEDSNGNEIRFPSQIVELVAALAIMAILIYFMSKEKFRKEMYPAFLVIYGVVRFGLNLLRETSPFVWILPAGNFWSLVAIAAGILWIAVYRFVKKRKAKEL